MIHLPARALRALALAAVMPLAACSDDEPAPDGTSSTGGGASSATSSTGSGAASSATSSTAVTSSASSSGAATGGGGSGGSGGTTGEGGGPGGQGGAGGDVPCSIDAPLWARAYGGPGDDQIVAVASDALGNLVVVGSFPQTIDFGGGALQSAGSRDAFVAKLDANGDHLWSKRFGGGDSDHAAAVAIAPDGRIAVGGWFGETVDFGGGPLSAGVSRDAFVLTLTSDGDHVWSVGLGGTSFDETSAVAIDAAGKVTAMGQFRETVALPTGTLTGTGEDDLFVVGLDASGVFLFGHGFGSTLHDVVPGLALAPSGDTVATGWVAGPSIDFGGGPLSTNGATAGFVARFDAAGSHLQSDVFGGGEPHHSAGVALDAAGNLFLSGGFSGPLDVGGAVIDAGSEEHAFVASLDPLGAPRWGMSPAGSYSGGFWRVVADAGGASVAGGSFGGAIDLGQGLRSTHGKADVFVLRLDAMGALTWGGCFGSVGTDQLLGLAQDATGAVVLGGLFEGAMDVGGRALVNADDEDAFLVKLGPLP